MIGIGNINKNLKYEKKIAKKTGGIVKLVLQLDGNSVPRETGPLKQISSDTF